MTLCNSLMLNADKFASFAILEVTVFMDDYSLLVMTNR